MSGTAKDSFVFYRSFYEALKNVPKKHRTEIYDAVFTYAFESQEPSLSGVPRALWELIRPQLDASERRYENARRGAEHGKKGGRPRKNDSEKKPLKGYETETLNVNVNVNDNDNVNDNVNVNVNAEDTQPERLEDLPDKETAVADYYRGYCILRSYQQRDNFVKRFLAYRHSNWKADLRSWADKDAETDKMKKQPSGSRVSFENQRDMSDFDPYAMGLFANNQNVTT